ncbi:MAG: transcriptional regulator [Nitrososphaerales archaeon]|nr:transcriptional regulator [Nitrososphaerales archaeon]
MSQEGEKGKGDLTLKVYKMIIERGKEGIFQSDLWRSLGLTSRDGSRLAIRLEKMGLIRREKVLDKGRWTYRLTPLRLPIRMESIEHSPCINCENEAKCAPDGAVTPYTCDSLINWARKEYEEFIAKESHVTNESANMDKV